MLVGASWVIYTKSIGLESNKPVQNTRKIIVNPINQPYKVLLAKYYMVAIILPALNPSRIGAFIIYDDETMHSSRSSPALIIVGVRPGHALLLNLPQRPAAAVLLLLLLLRRRRIGAGTSTTTSNSSLVLLCRCGAMAALMPMRWRRRRSGACELLDDGAELVGLDDVDRRVRGVPAPPVRPGGGGLAAGSCVDGLLLLVLAAVLH